MGCKVLLQCKDISGLSVKQLVTEVSKVLVTVCAQKRRDADAGWDEKITLLRQKQMQQTYDGVKTMQGNLDDVYIVDLSDDPKHLYFVKKGSAPQIIVSYPAMRQMFYDRLYYRNHVFLRIEGERYSLGDFQIALGIAKTREADEKVLGVVMQVEYLPIKHLEQSQQMLNEFIAMVEGMLQQEVGEDIINFQPLEPPYKSFGLSKQFSHLHSALQLCWLTSQV